MRVGINARALIDPHNRGFSRYTKELIISMHELAPEVEFYLYANRPLADEHKKDLSFATFRDEKKSFKLYWQGPWLKRQLKEDKIDIFHSPLNVGLPLAFKLSCPTLLTLHDDITHSHYSLKHFKLTRLWDYFNYYLEWFFAKKAQAIITVSQDSAKRIKSTMPIKGENLWVIPNGVKSYEAQKTPGSSFFLYAGGMERRKNIPFLIKSFKEAKEKLKFDEDLVLAGNPRGHLFDFENLPSCVRFIANPTDSELYGLYKNAQALILPSLQEGFGLQILEAYSQGTPVLASDLGAYKEVAGPYALFFNPHDGGDFVRAMDDFLQVKDRKATVENLLKSWASQFSWKICAQKTLQLYLQVQKRSGH